MTPEAKVEKRIVKQTHAQDGEAYKFTSPGHNGVPDRLLLFRVPLWFRKTLAKYVRFAEAKAPGETLRPDQVNEKARLEEMGFVVDVVDDPKWELKR